MPGSIFVNATARPLLWLNTLRYLQARQIVCRPVAKLRRRIPARPIVEQAHLRDDYRERRTYFPAQPMRISHGNFVFAEISCPLLREEIWQDRTKPQLWLYNVNYLDYLSELADDSAAHLIDRWIEHNSDSRTIGWDPYPVSRRVASLLRWITQRGAGPQPRWLASIYAQARHLAANLEYHLMANHLMENARALVFAGLMFRGSEAERWRAVGRAIVRQQLREQVLADGGHFERSPMYHSIVLEGLLDLINFGDRLDRDFVRDLGDAASRMLRHLKRVVHPDGQLALLNDSVHDVAPAPAELLAYGRRLGLLGGDEHERGWSRESGLAFVRDQEQGHYVVADLGPIGPDYQPGHAHADTLSFELSLFGRRVIVDSGVSDYAASAARRRARSTLAHNTVVVDDADQSEMWSAFRVARRAYPFGQRFRARPGIVCFGASHKGYLRLSQPCIHRRRFRWRRGALAVTDQIVGRGEHRAQSLLHLHPEVRGDLIAPAELRLSGSDGRELAMVRARSGLRWHRRETVYSPTLGQEIPNQVWSLKSAGCLPLAMGYEISWPE